VAVIAMDDPLEHFLTAQAPVLDAVVTELSNGRKESHWMWFIFPQIQGLGHSAMARRFAIQSLEQAQRYLQHPILGPRLRQHTQLVLNVQDRSISDIFGDPDDLKFHSSMTLFDLAAPGDPLFLSVLAKYFSSQQDQNTLRILQEIGD
jgi:uncharacterized protein (DUF1810 family)